MPLPKLSDYARLALLTDPETAAEITQVDPLLAAAEVQALARATEVAERQLLRDSYAVAPAVTIEALNSRDGRRTWLQQVMLGELQIEGSFGRKQAFPPAARLTAAKLLGAMHGDFVHREEITINHEAVVVFRIPDNGRLPETAIDVDADED
jgi:hypothetical protein